MLSWTWPMIQTKLWNDLDIQDENFISDSELIGYVNEAIDDAEAEIHKLGLEDRYFLTSDAVSFVTNASDLTMPSSIYANKVVALLYNDGNTKYEIKRLKRIPKINDVDPNDDYMYLIVNNAATSSAPVMRLFPPSRETSSSNVTRWYIRNATKLTLAGGETCDIPEFINYVLQHVKKRVYEKEGNPNVAQAVSDAANLRALMITTLENMVEDEHSEIDPDFNFYADFDSYDLYHC